MVLADMLWKWKLEAPYNQAGDGYLRIHTEREPNPIVAVCAVPRATFESMQLQESANSGKVTSVRAGYRQAIDASGDCSRERLQAV
jgi:hypothetical protein